MRGEQQETGAEARGVRWEQQETGPEGITQGMSLGAR